MRSIRRCLARNARPLARTSAPAREDLTIRELAETVAAVLGFDGELIFDSTRPDGTPQKLLDVSLIQRLGWHARTSLAEGIRLTYEAARPQLEAAVFP